MAEATFQYHITSFEVAVNTFLLLISFADALQLAWLAMTQPQAVAAAYGGADGLAGILLAAAAARGSGGGGGGGYNGSMAGQLSSDPLRPLAMMPDLQVHGPQLAGIQYAAWI